MSALLAILAWSLQAAQQTPLGSCDLARSVSLRESARQAVQERQYNRAADLRSLPHAECGPAGPVHGELPKWPECGGLAVLILLPGCATSSSYSATYPGLRGLRNAQYG
jgi:hypothetical protein